MPESLEGSKVYKGGTATGFGSSGDYLPTGTINNEVIAGGTQLKGLDLETASKVGLGFYNLVVDVNGRAWYVPKTQEGPFIPD